MVTGRQAGELSLTQAGQRLADYDIPKEGRAGKGAGRTGQGRAGQGKTGGGAAHLMIQYATATTRAPATHDTTITAISHAFNVGWPDPGRGGSGCSGQGGLWRSP